MQNKSKAGALLWLLGSASVVQAFTRTTTDIGTDLYTRTVTSDGVAKQTVSSSVYTSYFIFMNDNNSYSTFVGIPKTTTDKNGDPSVYLSRELYVPPEDDVATFSNPSTKTNTNPSATATGPTPTPTPSASQSGNTDDDSNKQSAASDEDSQHNGKGKSSNIGAIAGGVAAGVIILIVLGVVGWFYKRKHDRKRHIAEHKREEMQFLAMELDGSYNPNQKSSGDPLSEGSFYASPLANRSITDDLASRYTGGSLSIKPPVLREAYPSASYPLSVGSELTMDSQGRLGMPDGSPFVIDSIMPVKNVKASDNYTDLEWFPLVGSEEELEYYAGPSYVEEKELSHVATYMQKTSGQKGMSPALHTQKKF
ncbi:hypothetical protein LPJ53_005496 [Coemansia erecta]|uniref:Mid2 domain-containing protein n=1 Tax=Coemansia erecta TaxID=147472 RepID=A0A9W8CQG2_9FUNG|nr:hypothetical protein LPJ53_005496 [Coemansia erecta]